MCYTLLPSPLSVSPLPKSASQTSGQKVAKSRSVVPIKSTIEAIKGYPDKLVIFKVPASDFWWTRYFDGRHIKRSTKTDKKLEAIKFAKEFYEQLLVSKRLGISSNPRETSFLKAAEEVLAADALKAQRGELSASYVQNHKSVIRGHITDFLGKYELGDIDYGVLEAFKTYLFDKNLASATIKLHLVFVKKILDHAQRSGVITTSPMLPKVKTDDNPRGYFTLPEYWDLRRKALRLRDKSFELRQVIDAGDGDTEQRTKKLRNVVLTEEIALLIPFMIYTFIRPTDVKSIQHRHIQIKQGTDGKDYLWMPIPASKRHNKPITSMPRAATFYKRLRANRLAQLNDPNANIDDEYVFAPTHLNRDYAYRTLARQFDVLLEATGLRHNADGDLRSMYSLRHTSIMYRLQYGGTIDSLLLANNARTSVDMVERFYASHLESSHVTGQLHAKKTPPRKKAPKAQVKPGRSVIITVPEPDGGYQQVHGSSGSSTDIALDLNLNGIVDLPDH